MPLRFLLRSLALVVGAAVGVALGARGATSPTVSPTLVDVPSAASTPVGVDPLAAEAARLGAAYDCSPSGLPDGVVARHAVIRVGDEVRLVPFARGWAAYLGEAPGTLVSVCSG